jgi:hypothetical protein
MVTNHTDSVMQNIAYERIKYFVYSELNSTIFVNSERIDQCQKFINAGLKITTLPAEPVDQLVGIMLYSKLNAIMEDCIIINEVEISSGVGDNMIYFHSAAENLGVFNEPGWWHDADTVHYDINLLDSDKVVSMHHVSAWRELDLAWPDADAVDPADNTVVFANFRSSETK